MQRPHPTSRLIAESCGYNTGLLESLHHGLYELSLQSIYPNLDLDELIAFAASSWKSRQIDRNFRGFVEGADLYSIFQNVFRIGFPWLRKHQTTSDERLNPFQGKDLEERLARVEAFDVELLRGQLLKPVNEYVFECQYQERKAARGGENYGLEIMTFMPVYPKSGERHAKEFAKEVARMLRSYPTNYESLPQEKIERPRLVIPSLFPE